MKRTKSITERKANVMKQAISNLKGEDNIEQILRELEATKLWNSEMFRIYVHTYSQYVTISITGPNVEFVINEWCGPLHRKFNVDWRMVFDGTYNDIDLKTGIKGISVTITISEAEEFQSCTFRKVPVRIKTQAEIDRRIEEITKNKIEYEYIMDCNEEPTTIKYGSKTIKHSNNRR